MTYTVTATGVGREPTKAVMKLRHSFECQKYVYSLIIVLNTFNVFPYSYDTITGV